jgi:hypothetical protein
MGSYWQGKPKVRASAAEPALANAVGSNAVVVFSRSGSALDSVQEAVVVLPDGRTAKVSFPSANQSTAMAPQDTQTR